MDKKKIVKRTLKNMFERAIDVTAHIVSYPIAFGFTHASYAYFYITNPDGTDEELNQFLDAQLTDALAAERKMLNKISVKMGFGEYEPETEEKNHEPAAHEYDKVAYESLVSIFERVASYPEKDEAYGDDYIKLPDVEYMTDSIMEHIDTQDENIKSLWDLSHPDEKGE